MGRRFDHRFPDIDFPYVIELDRKIDLDPSEPDQFVSRDDTKPSPGTTKRPPR